MHQSRTAAQAMQAELQALRHAPQSPTFDIITGTFTMAQRMDSLLSRHEGQLQDAAESVAPAESESGQWNGIPSCTTHTGWAICGKHSL